MTPKTTRPPLALAVLSLLLPCAGLSAAGTPRVKAPVKFSSLTKQQLASLGDNDPIEFNGKVTTKSALLAPLRNARAEPDAEVKIKLARATSKLATLKVQVGKLCTGRRSTNPGASSRASSRSSASRRRRLRSRRPARARSSRA